MNEVVLKPIGTVIAGRNEIEDDFWGGEVSVIELDAEQFSEEVIMGLSDFSHLEVIFFMHKVSPEKIETNARHPRNNPEWPLVGIFAQRPKARPNRLGLSRCELLSVDGMKITVKCLDAIVGTPILDIKPFMREYGVRGEVRQSEWRPLATGRNRPRKRAWTASPCTAASPTTATPAVASAISKPKTSTPVAAPSSASAWAPPEDAAEAQRWVESRQSTGKVLLVIGE